MRYLADKLSFRSERDEMHRAKPKLSPVELSLFRTDSRHFGASCEVIFASYTVYIVICCERVKDSEKKCEKEKIQRAKIILNLFDFYFFDNT